MIIGQSASQQEIHFKTPKCDAIKQNESEVKKYDFICWGIV